MERNAMSGEHSTTKIKKKIFGKHNIVTFQSNLGIQGDYKEHTVCHISTAGTKEFEFRS
jgi:hypothetical protein